jgi:hypothetical protein
MKTLFAIAFTQMFSAAYGDDEKPYARLGSHGPYPACEQPSELDTLLEMRAHNRCAKWRAAPI